MSAPPPPRAKVVSLCGKEIAAVDAELHPLAQERERVREALTHWAAHARAFVGVVISDEGRVMVVSSMDDGGDAFALLSEGVAQLREPVYNSTLLKYDAAPDSDFEDDEDEDDDGGDDDAS